MANLVVAWVLAVSLSLAVSTTTSTVQAGASFPIPNLVQVKLLHHRQLNVGDSASAASWQATSRESTVRSLLDSETSTDGNEKKKKKQMISKKWLIVIVMATTTVAAIAVILLRQWMRARQGRNRNRSTSSGMLVWTNQLCSLQHLDFSDSDHNSCSGSARIVGLNAPWLSSTRVPCFVPYNLMRAATQNFRSSNLLGEGSFGLVYKAQLDYDVKAAVKRLCGGGSELCLKEFQGEVDLMSKIKHPNLVALLGYSNDGPEPLVVYELMQNGSLHDQLHGPSHGAALTWHLRLKIALEAARGLEHLHENCKPAIIHRDFKASNILLDASFNAKVSDFGMAVALEEGGLLKEDVQVQGTFGYIAPEYLMNGTLTEKSDVYGFGVVLLELLTGRLPIDTSLLLRSQSLIAWASPSLTNREKLMDIIDPCLQSTTNEKHLHQVAAVAALCVQAEPSYRPLITDVVQSLLPLVPQELGGALRDGNDCKT